MENGAKKLPEDLFSSQIVSSIKGANQRFEKGEISVGEVIEIVTEQLMTALNTITGNKGQYPKGVDELPMDFKLEFKKIIDGNKGQFPKGVSISPLVINKTMDIIDVKGKKI